MTNSGENNIFRPQDLVLRSLLKYRIAKYVDFMLLAGRINASNTAATFP